MDELRSACAQVAARALSVHVNEAAIPAYAGRLGAPPQPTVAPHPGPDEAAYWLTLDAINFGSGWFPTLRKHQGLSGYNTIAHGWRAHHAAHGPFAPAQLLALDAGAVAEIVDQDPTHELMALYAASLNDLGAHLQEIGGYQRLTDDAHGSAVAFAHRLGGWTCFADTSTYDELAVPFLKRAQIAAADLERAGAARFDDIDGLTMFADNLVPHVLRLDGVLRFDEALVARIARGELIEHGSREEVEIRACALHAVELVVRRLREDGASQATAAAVDELLWNQGQQPGYKAVPRHRSRCTAY